MLGFRKIHLLFALIFSCAFICGTINAFAQSNTRTPVSNINKGAKSVSDSVNTGVQQVNKELQKQTDKVNKAIERGMGKVSDKIDDKVDVAKDKVSTGMEKIKAATIKKNTLVTRTYHNVTAYYNVYFNADNSYEEGIKKAAKEYPFDYTKILPIFTFGAKEIPQLVNAEMGRTLEKADKTIKQHSLTTKPNIKKGKRLTKKEQEFYNKREYCNSVDDAYLLIGKANVYLHEYELAERAFDLVTVDYNTELTSYEARIWNAIVAGATGNAQREQEIITTLQNDKKLPKTYNKLLNEATADLLIRQKKYEEAIPKVEQAVKSSWNRTTSQRYHYILGQLYQNVGNSKKAIEHYTSVIRRMPPYDMEFQAKLNKAFLSAGNKAETMRRMLEKMAKDEKNKDHLDQIYFALANIEMRAKRTEQAIGYYKLSAMYSKSESPQRMLSCYTLAKYYESKGDYEPAQAYYDSTAMVMPKENPDYEMVSNKAQNLGKLAINLRIIKTEDSLQRIARMSERDREKYVEKQIAQSKALEEKKVRDEEIKIAREAMVAETSSAFAKPTSGKWYFYNPQVVGKGLAEFRRTWGNRKLTDSWRRGSKNVVNDFPTMDDTHKQQDEEKAPATQTAEYYLANVPLTDSLMDASNKRVIEAMFDAGLVYKDYILDRPNAIEMLEALNKRYPDNRHKLETYFYLYVLNNEENNSSRAEFYKNLLVKEFPDELLTKYVLDPKFVSDNEKLEKEANALYDQAYSMYNARKYDQAVSLSAKGMQQYEKMGIAANFKLLNVMATAGNGNIGQYIAGLGEVSKQYPGTNAASAAQEMLNIVQKRELQLVSERDAKPEPQSSEPLVNYSTEDGESVFAIIIPKATNLNQLKFNFISFNADIDADDLLVSNRTFNNELEVVTVGPFKTQAEALTYYKKVKGFPNIFKDLKLETYSMFSITQHNLELLEHNKIISLYVTFFQTNIEKK